MADSAARIKTTTVILIELTMTSLWLLLLGAVAAVVVWLVREFGPQRPPTDDPLAILDQGFARGETNQEEYEARRQVLLRHRLLV